MLPTHLLRTRRRRDSIFPVYAEIDSSNEELATLLIDLYCDHIGHKKRQLNGAVSELETLGYDYRFVRGLAALLDRRCELVTKTVVDPPRVRRTIFQVVSEKGIPTSIEERSQILRYVAEALKIDVEGIYESFYGDLEEEMIVASFNSTTPIDLLKQYNVSLTQTLLFNASELSFTASGNWQRIFRQIKWLGLIYSVTLYDPDYWVTVDGPMSLFKLTKRYGTALAKLLPVLFSSQSWKLDAKVVSRSDKRRLLHVALDSRRYGHYMKQSVEDATYDSRIEEDFAVRFTASIPDWELSREPGPLRVGRQVMIPDFLMRKGELTVYLEVVGFWTPEYLEEKMKKLRSVRDIDMIVAVDRRLASRKPLKQSDAVNRFYYKGKIPLKPVLTYLKNKERSLIAREVQILQNQELHLKAAIVEAEDLAHMLGISVAAVKETIPQLEVAGYRRLNEMFVKQTLLTAIDEALTKRLRDEKLSFTQASRLIESMGGRNASLILDALGYQIMWYGINPEAAEIRKVKSI